MIRTKKKLYALVTGAAGLLGTTIQKLLWSWLQFNNNDINKKSLKDNFYKLKKLKLSNKIFLEKLNVYNETNIRMLIKKYKNEYIYVLINNAS